MFGHKEGASVMDNKRSTQDRIGADPSILKSRLSKFLTLGVGLFVGSAALSAVISINTSQNPENEITLSGDLKASVEYTANGLKIEIPGVEIKLTCDGAEVSEYLTCLRLDTAFYDFHCFWVQGYLPRYPDGVSDFHCLGVRANCGGSSGGTDNSSVVHEM